MFVDIVADFARQHSKGDSSVLRGSHVWSTLDHDNVSSRGCRGALRLPACLINKDFAFCAATLMTAKTLERSSRKGVVEVMVCVLVIEEEDEESQQTQHTSLVSAPSIQICNTHSDKP